MARRARPLQSRRRRSTTARQSRGKRASRGARRVRRRLRLRLELMPRHGEVLGALRGDGALVRDVRLGLEISRVVVASGLRGCGGSSRVRPNASLEHASGGHGLGDETGVGAAGGVRVCHSPDGGHHHFPSSRAGGVGAAAGFGGGAGERRGARGVSARVRSRREGLTTRWGEGLQRVGHGGERTGPRDRRRRREREEARRGRRPSPRIRARRARFPRAWRAGDPSRRLEGARGARGEWAARRPRSRHPRTRPPRRNHPRSRPRTPAGRGGMDARGRSKLEGEGVGPGCLQRV